MPSISAFPSLLLRQIFLFLEDVKHPLRYARPPYNVGLVDLLDIRQRFADGRSPPYFLITAGDLIGFPQYLVPLIFVLGEEKH